MDSDVGVAYFSMEIGLEPNIPTYAGGLGVLAGDTLRSAADMDMPMVAVTLLARKGYFHQRIDASGWQTEEAVIWPVNDYLKEMPPRVTLDIEGRPITVRCWQYEIKGVGGHVVPVYLLDTDLPDNTDSDRSLTDYLYGGGDYYRLCQEAILGIGGIRMLRALGHTEIRRYHMNEGHASLLVLELLAEHAARLGDPVISEKHVDAVRRQCVFTTHTPVPAGHDKFPLDLAYRVLGAAGPLCDRAKEFCYEGKLNLTYLALDNSHYVNGVAKKHGEISRQMFTGYQIDSITNGIHVASWACAPMQALFDRCIPGWREDNASLRYALRIPREAVWEAHRAAKRQLIEHVNRTMNTGMDRDVFTIGFARRATQYKRADLLLQDVDRLQRIASQAGPLQIIYAGKAHPLDQRGKDIIQHIHRLERALQNKVMITYLPQYDMGLAKLLTAGCDLWLNTPQPPMEASGTSGMKAAVNGVPSLSILDGWWIEGCIEGITGWAIGDERAAPNPEARRDDDAQEIYDKLEQLILPMYYNDRDRFVEIMRSAIAVNGSFFNTERMLNQYIAKAYFT